MKTLLLLTGFFMLTGLSVSPLIRSAEKTQQQIAHDEAEVLYLPNGEAINFVSFGYRNALADYFWFKTINYFGKHYTTDRNYKWLFHMCDLVTDLDPRAEHVYSFGGTMLAWEARAYNDALELFSKAIKNIPENWLFYYYRGFTYMYFLKDLERAKDDFITAAKLPESHPVVQRLAEKKIAALDDPSTAVEFLIDMYEKTDDPNARAALRGRIHELKRKVAESEQR